MRYGGLGPGLVAALVLLGGASGLAADDGEPKLWVRGLRVDPLPLLACDAQLTKRGEASKADLVQPWVAEKDPDRPSILRVKVKDESYCVRAFMVETSTPVSANTYEKGCGPGTGKPRDSGATRNLGKECR